MRADNSRYLDKRIRRRRSVDGRTLRCCIAFDDNDDADDDDDDDDVDDDGVDDDNCRCSQPLSAVAAVPTLPMPPSSPAHLTGT